jgi:hypothetical protein
MSALRFRVHNASLLDETCYMYFTHLYKIPMTVIFNFTFTLIFHFPNIAILQKSQIIRETFKKLFSFSSGRKVIITVINIHYRKLNVAFLKLLPILQHW